MLRHVADSLLRTLLRAFPGDRPYPPDDYRKAPMPAPVAHFLDRTLTDRVTREVERLRATRTGWVDYAHPDVRDLFASLDRTMREHARVPEPEWERALRHAVHQVTRHAVQPLDTLVDFVFQDDDDTLPVGVVQQRMEFFSAYGYLRDAVGLYVDQKGIDVLPRHRFAELLKRVAHQMTSDYTPEQWLRLIDPLFSLASSTPGVREGHVPAVLLLSFFEEHDHSAAARRLQQRLADDEQVLLDRDALRTLLGGRGEPAPAGRRAEPQAAPPRSRAEPPRPEKAEGPVPLWKQFRSQAPEKPQAPTPRTQPGDADEPVPLWQRFRPRPSGGTDSRSSNTGDELASLERDVLSAEGRTQRDRFVRHLFGDSIEAYRSALRRLHTASDWNEASQIIGREVFRKHGVNIYSDEAIAFTDAVEARFR